MLMKSILGNGIGKSLMDKAEELAIKEKMHKIYLETGKNWDVAEFYKKLGYEQTGVLPQHYQRQDYIILSKFL